MQLHMQSLILAHLLHLLALPTGLKRLTIALGGTSEEWSYGADIVTQLLECCDDELKKVLTREANVMIAIKTLAVRKENIMAARVAFANMLQDRNETMRSFGARIKGKLVSANM